MKRTSQSNLCFGALLVGALLTGCAPLVTQETQHAIDTAGTRADDEAFASRYEQEASSAQAKADEYRKMLEWYERPGNGNYATVKGGLINQLNYLVRKYQVVAEQNRVLAQSQRVGVMDNSRQ